MVLTYKFRVACSWYGNEHFYCLYYVNKPSLYIHFSCILHNDVLQVFILNLASNVQLHFKNR